mmetsp:Transcript_5257/g.13630  ORF Transcript_5257/g.13630 Transcript_5257/m.13630 type:complete len:280 (-) Transcript_5257:314-1153(-)
MRTPCVSSALTRRSLSLIANSVAIVTTTNCVASGSLKRACTRCSCFFTASSRSTAVPRACSRALAAARSASDWKSPPTSPLSPSRRARSCRTFPMVPSRKSGSVSRRSVCPVGAVSKMTRVNASPVDDESSPSSSSLTTSEMARNSSKPGGGVSNNDAMSRSSSASASPPSPNVVSVFLKELFVPSSDAAWIAFWNLTLAAAASTSIPHIGRDAGVSIATGAPPETSWSIASLSECAGSVETTRTRCPSCASLSARDAEVDVLPTPPLPPTRRYLHARL